jgi:peptidoglycan/xylan/chitin deacetylase (PgdA/CDA1 family)
MSPKTIPVLLYHSISDVATPAFRRWAVSPDLFTQHIAFMAGEGYTPLTVSDYAERLRQNKRALPQKPVVVTFDDGLGDFFSHAFPTLARYKFTATLYITTGYVGKTSRWLAPLGEGERPMMTWEEIREVQAAGIECGGHTISHPQLDLLTPAAAQKEIAGCKEKLEEKLKTAISSFAYPHGYHNKMVQRLTQEAKFSSACGVKDALSTPGDDLYGLARLIISHDTGVEELARYLRGERKMIATSYEKFQTKVWRFYRQVRARVTQ